MTKLTYEKFMKILQKEHKYHKDGGTSYRQETARLAIEVANVIKETDSFLNPSFARQAVCLNNIIHKISSITINKRDIIASLSSFKYLIIKLWGRI